MDYSINDALIKKETIYGGTKFIPFKIGTRVKFHYQTRKCDENKTIIDDSKILNQPMELVLGKKFKLEVWEVIVQKMALNEVAKFTVDKSLVPQYPFISKTLRDARKPAEARKHCCGMTIQNEGIGYKDLDELFSNPCDLEFIIELLSVELPEQYEKETWQLNEAEKLIAIQDNKIKGNENYNRKCYAEAEENYRLALAMLEQLILREKPNDTEWLELIQLKIPLLLNFAQCRLIENDYYTVIEHCTEILKYDPTNVKGLFRRGKAHVGAWNLIEAKKDFEQAMKLDKSLTNTVLKELAALNEIVKLQNVEDKLKYQNLFN